MGEVLQGGFGTAVENQELTAVLSSPNLTSSKSVVFAEPDTGRRQKDILG